jgi:hypothetical protein
MDRDGDPRAQLDGVMMSMLTVWHDGTVTSQGSADRQAGTRALNAVPIDGA